jgi:hypothetical protein
MRGPSLHGIVRTLGGELYAGGARAVVPGPGHSPDDRSVSLWLQGDRVVIHCFAGDDWRDVQAELARLGLVDASGRIAGSAGFQQPTRASDRPSAATRTAAAAGLWAAGTPVAGTLSGKYLAARGVAPPAAGLRHHPGVAAAVYADQGPRRPALLAAIQEPEHGELVGVELTYLSPGGARAPIAVPRKTIGLRPAGAAIQLAPAAPRLLVGEGVFSCLSASEVFGLPAWALMSVGNLRRWRPPPEVRFVLIAGDRGLAGEASATQLVRALREKGVQCAVRLPEEPHGDWNEAAVARKAEEKKAGPGGVAVAGGWSAPRAWNLRHDRRS